MPVTWITPGQLAEELEVHEATVRRWLREDRLPSARRLPGGQYRLPSNAAKHLLRPAVPPKPSETVS